MEWELPPHGWAPQPHVHPGLTEEYEVLEGTLEVMVGDRWGELVAGDAATVPPGEVHTFRVGADAARVRNTHWPALDFEPYVRELCRAANEANLGDLSGPRALLYIAVLVRAYPQHSRAPGRLLNAAVPALAGLGRLLGFRPSAATVSR